MERLRGVIGHRHGLVIQTNASNGLQNAVDVVFPGVEHRECMRHLSSNFMRKFKGKFFEENLWSAAYTYTQGRHDFFLNKLYAQPKVKDYLEKHHPNLWARSKFGELSKVDYVCNYLPDSFNSKIRELRSLTLVLLLDAIRHAIMEKIDLRHRICARKFVGHKIVPKVVFLLNQRIRAMREINMRMIRSSNTLAEVYATDKQGIERRYPVDIANRSCACRKWQVTGLPCYHALFFILAMRGEGAEIENYVDEYFSVSKFSPTYAESIPAMRDPNDWETVSPGIKLEPPIVRGPRGRPRNLKITAAQPDDKCPRLGVRNNKCKRCGGFGHVKRLCDNPVVHEVQNMQHMHVDEEVPDHRLQEMQRTYDDYRFHDQVQEILDVHENQELHTSTESSSPEKVYLSTKKRTRRAEKEKCLTISSLYLSTQEMSV